MKKLKTSDKPRHPLFILRKSTNRQFYFVLTAKNGAVLVTSESYKTRRGAINGMQSTFANAMNAQILDKT